MGQLDRANVETPRFADREALGRFLDYEVPEEDTNVRKRGRDAIWLEASPLTYSASGPLEGCVVLKRLAERRERKDAKAAAERAQQAEAARSTRIAELRGAVAGLEDSIEFYADVEQAFDEVSGEAPIVTKKGEEVVLIASGVALVEVRRGKATYSGGSRGISVRVAKGVSYRVGAHQGTVQAAPEQPTIIDTGEFVVTNRRAVFVGDKHTREFQWSKLLACNDYAHSGRILFMLPVENRQRVSGIAAMPENATLLDQRIKFGLAMYQDRRDAFIDGLREEAETARSELGELEQDRVGGRGLSSHMPKSNRKNA